MALIKCPECAKEISSQANACPHCGYPILSTNNTSKITKPKKTKINKKVAIIVGVIFILVVVLFNVNLKESPIENEMDLLRDSLLDPDSLIVYEAYVNNTENKKEVLIYFGASNKSGGITDDWAYICGDTILFESDYEKAKRNGDNSGILKHGPLIMAQFSLESGAEGWEKVNL